MSHSTDLPADVDPQAVARAEDMWGRFVIGMKYGAIVIAIGVAVLAWITL